MSINISASAIVDFLACSQKVKYRINVPEQQVQTPAMLAGTIVHEIIETYKNKDAAYAAMEEKLEEYNLDKTMEARVVNSIDNFYSFFQQFTGDDDIIEHKFKIKHSDGVFLVGKFDRITPDGKLFDWKTSAVYPKDISNSIQFVFYYECYKKIYGTEPSSLFYAHLPSKKLIRYVPNRALTNYLFHDIIPNMIEDVKRGRFLRIGLYSKICKDCAFTQHCFKEVGYDVEENIGSFTQTER
jgi:CRISPR/Cas system-associated exonuclease Cas4 (RecB family)